MFTLYEVKQSSCFRPYYKLPSFLKNIIKGLILMAILGITYVVYFRADGGNLSNIMKVLKGMNSNTFNYLMSHRETLQIDRPIRKFGTNRPAKMPNTIEVFSDCVRNNRPCVFKGLAKEWPAFEKWNTKNNGTEYLSSKFEGKMVESYYDFNFD